MKEKILELFAKLRSLWENASRKTRLLFLLSLASAVVLIVLLALWVNYVRYVEVAGALSPQESANVLSVLGEMGVDSKISQNGTIMVPEQDANRVMMQLATKMNANFEYEFYQGLGITATQSDRTQANIYDLQRRLEGMIESFDEVAQATVTLSIPQPSLYALQAETAPPTASVKLTKRVGRSLTAEQVQGIMNLVKHGVAGLAEENITISDENGDLKAMMMVGSGSSLTKLNLTSQVNHAVRSQILSVLTPVFGDDNIQVAVNSILDTNNSTIHKETYIPFDEEDPTNNPRDFEEIEREKIGGDNNIAQGVPGANDNVDVPQYSAENLYMDDADSYIARDVIDYLVSSVREEIIKEGLEIVDLTVAVVINADTLPEGRKDQVVDLVIGASGIASENIKVQNMRFLGRPPIDPEGLSTRQLILIISLILLALAVMIAIIVLSVRKKRKVKEEAIAAEMSLLDLMGEEMEYEPIQLAESHEQKLKNQIRDLALSDPEIVAQLVKTWLLS